MTPRAHDISKTPDETDSEFEDELLDTGQEEIFSRSEVERGVTEHQSGSGEEARGPTSDGGARIASQGASKAGGGADAGASSDDPGRGGD